MSFHMNLLYGIINLDQDITLAINSLNSPFTDSMWMFFSRVQIWFPMYAIIVACLFWRLGWKKALVFTIALGLTILCCDQLANVCKSGFERLRPCNDPYMIENGIHIVKRGRSFGFFSAHAANSFAFACGSLIAMRSDKRLKYRGYAIGIFAWATLVSLSRIFVSMHFLGDVLVGAMIGMLIGGGFGYLARAIGKRWDKKTSAETL